MTRIQKILSAIKLYEEMAEKHCRAARLVLVYIEHPDAKQDEIVKVVQTYRDIALSVHKVRDSLLEVAKGTPTSYRLTEKIKAIGIRS